MINGLAIGLAIGLANGQAICFSGGRSHRQRDPDTGERTPLVTVHNWALSPSSVVVKGDGHRWHGVRDVNELVRVVFSGVSALVVEGVTDEGEVIRVSARTRDDPVPCPVCGQPAGRMHGFHGRVVADVAVGGRRVVASVRVRRLVCPVPDCPRQTFREQVPVVVERYQRRTNRLRPTRLRGQGVSGPGGRPPLPRAALRDLPLDRSGHAHAKGGTAAAHPARARHR
ncbi:hypothetical protein Sipo8835_08475 [Streptomyces ipomoeae]|uniref:Transposase IS204/IS1001/IS1096/IS1165 zinc-finger domain-containing protein n=1 Tax=Streptomyces ipomoeae TaxID=103232 RepID=A0AAE8W4V9_9ACTN|nr:hypothetical protein Sipo8835_08475 [Streptomyces ipomoeae]TQE40267.1 hypothetical protein Sipo7851_00975 [Streptomyces ipomoeae]